MPTVGKTSFTWFMPNESTLSEAFGGDSSQVQAVVQIKGDAATRRQCAADLLEYPVFVTNGKFRYISRHLPLAYPQPFVSGESDDGVQLYAARFSGGKGVGPRGQDAGVAASPNLAAQVPLPVYQVYQYDCEFTDRTYDILPDSAVLSPGQIQPPGGVTATDLARLPGAINAGLPANTYYAGVTATNAFGETNVIGNLASVNLNQSDFLVVAWQPVAGATGYKVYLGVGGGGNPALTLFGGAYPTTVGSVTFNGPLPTTAGSPPAANTTAGPLWDPVSGVGLPDEGSAIAAGDGQIGGRYITRNARPGGQGVTIPRSFMYYQDTGIGIPEGMLKIVPTVSLVYTWAMVPRAATPSRAIINTLGCLNDAPFDGWPAGTLLFDSVDPRRYRSALGGRVIDWQYTFTGKPNIDLNGVAQGHNSALEFIPAANGQPAKVDYVQVRSAPPLGLGNPPSKGGGNPPYRSADFSALFRPTPGV